MKLNKVLIPLMMSSVLLTSCMAKTISKEAFVEEFNQVKENLVLSNEKLDNVKIHNFLNISTYNYKAGEFYAYHMFALLLIIPVYESDYTWKDNDGKYYHFKESTGKKGAKIEIDEETFNAYMSTGRQKILNQLLLPVSENELLMSDNPGHENVKNTYYKKGSNKLYFKSTYTDTVQESEKEIEEHITVNVNYSDFMPVKYVTNNKEGKSKTEWTYEYGKAAFTFTEDTTSESAS